MPGKVKYYFGKNNEFIIDNYYLAKPFSSFFCGIAGQWGVPAWVFYVNRGQAIASFGTKDKDNPIMEFQPANKSYYLGPILGFRTFIKIMSASGPVFYDAFSTSLHNSSYDIKNSMIITSAGLKLSEVNHTLGIGVCVEYFTIPGDTYGALARKVTITNLAKEAKEFEVLDGLPQIQPYGVNNFFLKQMSRTIEAWVVVENLENDLPFFRLKVEPADRPEVVHVKRGNFYAPFDSKGAMKVIVQPDLVFGAQNDLIIPAAFLRKGFFPVPKCQFAKSKTPCAFAYKRIRLKQGDEYVYHSISGNISSLDNLKAQSKRITEPAYFDRKKIENDSLVASLQSTVFTKSSSAAFDSYCAQNFLDNIMRGGYPVSIEYASGRKNLYLYSRKHGDLERDYNMFLLEPSCFSQGNGNYRDINQNRRCDAWFNPALGSENIYYFFNLLQTDGYNPLVICPDRFEFNQDKAAISGFLNRYNMEKVSAFLKNDFTPGELMNFIDSNNIMLRGSRPGLLSVIMENSTKHSHAVHGEGFWTDHWHYCLDLLESFAGLYPEMLNEILFQKEDFTFFDNAYIVSPRSKRHLLHKGFFRQFGSVVKDAEKESIIASRGRPANISRSKNGKGGIYNTTLLVKMAVVIANKFASLDPFGCGIEMEADKPNWYDSLNGLPGLLGSSTCETFELKRWIMFLRGAVAGLGPAKKNSARIPVELYDLLNGLCRTCESGLSDFTRWDRRNSLKEKYRLKTKFGFEGSEKEIRLKELDSILRVFLSLIDRGLEKAYDKKSKLYRSYFINEAVEYSAVSKDPDKVYARAGKFRQTPLPFFLEGMVHAFRVSGKKDCLKYHKTVRSSGLFDKKLKMYKVCAALCSMPEEIGRSRVFTPGWLENESVWLHMEYKYMLELLKSGLYREFFDDFRNVFVPFMKPEIYGRSIFENSSFIVSSAFPEKGLHGNGFVARLSGSTAEFINIWLIMCLGHRPFYLDKEARLCAGFKPILPGWLFTAGPAEGFAKGVFAFSFLSKTQVVYHNPLRKDTFGPSGAKIKSIFMRWTDGRTARFKGASIPYPYSNDIRKGDISRIEIEMA
ncbi:MAG: cellobiose phosphorylase [Candidatus Omnitrophica bacterium]|nr:cellobiose phosphorylase [Candidatus Omnitrophota bacterium]